MTSSDIAIRVENLGKRYFLSHENSTSYKALRDSFAHLSLAGLKLINPFTLSGQLRACLKAPQLKTSNHITDEFWALKDVSFDIYHGERIGIVGRNGAGKSTLLKLLARITEPTTGRVEISGRVASLLEVGTGFHPELTGRENIYLNGSVLGMSRREITRKFDEIVGFAEVDRFLDTPVKRYSSGMYVRLAFAVAAHLEPDILIVDEVLAVGDASFQAKCLGKMEEVTASEGRTVLFVSHQMSAISKLCNRSIYLENGQLIASGSTQKIIAMYAASASSLNFSETLAHLKRKGGDRNCQFSTIQIFNDGRPTQGIIFTGSSVLFSLSIDTKLEKNILDPQNCRIALGLFNDYGVSIVLSTEMLEHVDHSSCKNVTSAKFLISKMPLTPGLYRIVLFLEAAGVVQDWITDGIFCEVEGGDYYGSGKICPTGYEGKCVLVDYSVQLS
jgi:lipopolysaccharide transport system ATP-binding protein